MATTKRPAAVLPVDSSPWPRRWRWSRSAAPAQRQTARLYAADPRSSPPHPPPAASTADARGTRAADFAAARRLLGRGNLAGAAERLRRVAASPEKPAYRDLYDVVGGRQQEAALPSTEVVRPTWGRRCHVLDPPAPPRCARVRGPPSPTRGGGRAQEVAFFRTMTREGRAPPAAGAALGRPVAPEPPCWNGGPGAEPTVYREVLRQALALSRRVPPVQNRVSGRWTGPAVREACDEPEHAGA
jgi:hypothetical protein